MVIAPPAPVYPSMVACPPLTEYEKSPSLTADTLPVPSTKNEPERSKSTITVDIAEFTVSFSVKMPPHIGLFISMNWVHMFDSVYNNWVGFDPTLNKRRS
jgi:hypothetical protein